MGISNYNRWQDYAPKERWARFKLFLVLTAIGLAAVFYFSGDYKAQMDSAYSVNAPYVFAVKPSVFKTSTNHMIIYTMCEPDRDISKRIRHNLPENMKFTQYNLEQEKGAGKGLHKIMQSVGKPEGFKGPVFVVNGHVILYNPNALKQIHEVMKK